MGPRVDPFLNDSSLQGTMVVPGRVLQGNLKLKFVKLGIKASDARGMQRPVVIWMTLVFSDMLDYLANATTMFFIMDEL